MSEASYRFVTVLWQTKRSRLMKSGKTLATLATRNSQRHPQQHQTTKARTSLGNLSTQPKPLSLNIFGIVSHLSILSNRFQDIKYIYARHTSTK